MHVILGHRVFEDADISVGHNLALAPVLVLRFDDEVHQGRARRDCVQKVSRLVDLGASLGCFNDLSVVVVLQHYVVLVEDDFFALLLDGGFVL